MRHISKRTPDIPQIRGRINWRKHWGLFKFRAKLAAFPVSIVGILMGLGFFILSMIQMSFVFVAGSAAILGVSVAVFIWVYLWATAAVE